MLRHVRCYIMSDVTSCSMLHPMFHIVRCYIRCYILSDISSDVTSCPMLHPMLHPSDVTSDVTSCPMLNTMLHHVRCCIRCYIMSNVTYDVTSCNIVITMLQMHAGGTPVMEAATAILLHVSCACNCCRKHSYWYILQQYCIV